MATTWSVTPSAGVTNTNDGNFTFPSNTGTSSIEYTITAVDDDGCSATKKITVNEGSECRSTVNNATCRKFNFIVESARIYLTVDADTLGTIYYSYGNDNGSFKGNIGFIFNGSSKSENYISLPLTFGSYLGLSLTSSSSNEGYNPLDNFEEMREMTNYYEYYQYWDLPFDCLLFGRNSIGAQTWFSDENGREVYPWIEYCAEIDPSDYVTIGTNSSLCQIDPTGDIYDIYSSKGMIPLKDLGTFNYEFDWGAFMILKEYGNGPSFNLCDSRLTFKTYSELERDFALEAYDQKGNNYIYALPTKGLGFYEGVGFTLPIFVLATPGGNNLSAASGVNYNSFKTHSEVSWYEYNIDVFNSVTF